MRRYIEIMVVLFLMAVWSLFYVIAGSAWLTVAVFSLSVAGFLTTLCLAIIKIVLKYISKWKRNQ